MRRAGRPRGARTLLQAAAALAAAVLALAATACASDGDGADPVPLATAELPPSGTAPMAEAYDAALAPLGWRVQRSSLEEQNFEPGTSIPPGRRHLALYLRPTGTPTPQDYFDALATVTRLFVPRLFEDHKGLASFDVCLEPTEADVPSNYPKPLTQVLVTRRQATLLDWARATPADVVAGADRHPNVLTLYVSDELKKSPEWASLQAAAAGR